MSFDTDNLYSTSTSVLRRSSLTAERAARWTVTVLSICQNLIITWAELKEPNNAVLRKRPCYIRMAPLQPWEKHDLGKHCADAVISAPELMWSKAPKYALCSVSTPTNASQVSVFAPTYSWINVPQSTIFTQFFPF